MAILTKNQILRLIQKYGKSQAREILRTLYPQGFEVEIAPEFEQWDKK